VGSEGLILIIAACVFGGYMAWNIGSNDVANAMGTSVGSRALTIRQAIVAAAVADFLGAVLVGGHVTDTVRSKMIDPSMFAHDPPQLAVGMLAALLAAGLWIQLASYLKIPVSTTQAVIGGVVGFAVIGAGAAAVEWGKLSQIVLSWIIAPTMAGLGGYLLSTLVRERIINARDPVSATRRWAPILVFIVFFTLCLVIFYKGLSNLRLDLDWQQAAIISALVAGLAAVFGWILVGRAEPAPEDREMMVQVNNGHCHAELVASLKRSLEALRGARETSATGVEPGKVEEAALAVEKLVEEAQACTPTTVSSSDRSYRFVERVFSSLQVVTACCVAFAHGSNDVANAVGPLAGIVNVVETGRIDSQVAVPFWTLLLGGSFIALGIATWGPRVMQTVGERITYLTPTRGFSAEFAAASTIVIASRLGLPVSTTHAVVGAVVGVGLARGMGSVDWRVMGKMASMWLLEVPAVAVLSALLFMLLRVIF
jgi:phosphate/sulfate permease